MKDVETHLMQEVGKRKFVGVPNSELTLLWGCGLPRPWPTEVILTKGMERIEKHLRLLREGPLKKMHAGLSHE